MWNFVNKMNIGVLRWQIYKKRQHRKIFPHCPILLNLLFVGDCALATVSVIGNNRCNNGKANGNELP